MMNVGLGIGLSTGLFVLGDWSLVISLVIHSSFDLRHSLVIRHSTFVILAVKLKPHSGSPVAPSTPGQSAGVVPAGPDGTAKSGWNPSHQRVRRRTREAIILRKRDQ